MTKVGAYAIIRVYTIIFHPDLEVTAGLFDVWLLPAALLSLAIGMTGCRHGAGVSTVAANTAIRCADLGMGRVLLVDANFRYPKLAGWLGERDRAGLFELVTGATTVGNCVSTTSYENLHFMAAGKSPQSVAFSHDAIQNTLTELRGDFDWILFDLPVVDNVGSTEMFASHLDGVALVVENSKTRTRDAKKALETLHENSVPIIGTILNRQRRVLPRWIERWL